MKLFLDTNILLDLIQNRKEVQNAKAIINAVKKGFFEGSTALITLTNIDYIVKKQNIDSLKFIEFINSNFKILDGSNEEVFKALKIENRDFEDNIQIAIAKKYKCEVIITNDKKFPKNQGIEVLNSEEFIEKYIL
ncbi:putative nucleic acid-binding protein, contains PIN domain [Thiovulum sp. ES]|nr:putative nucleic acid-binding protein, contains PIN domain [Thiovulum sp. ES]